MSHRAIETPRRDPTIMVSLTDRMVTTGSFDRSGQIAALMALRTIEGSAAHAAFRPAAPALTPAIPSRDQVA